MLSMILKILVDVPEACSVHEENQGLGMDETEKKQTTSSWLIQSMQHTSWDKPIQQISQWLSPRVQTPPEKEPLFFPHKNPPKNTFLQSFWSL